MVLLGRSINEEYGTATQQEAATERIAFTLGQHNLMTLQTEEYTMAKKSREPVDPPTYAGQGVIFAVIDDRETMPTGNVSTIDIIEQAIDGALDRGHDTPRAIARYLTTSAFQHVTDKRVRFNSVLKAGDAVGAQILRKLYNSYNELAEMAEAEEDPRKKAEIKAEASGFAAAVQIVLSPFSSEAADDPRLVDWDEVDRMTALWEKEQRLVRKERKGNPQ